LLQYNVFSLLFSWFALANLWLTFSIIIDLLPSQTPAINVFGTADITHWINMVLKWFYLAFLGLQVCKIDEVMLWVLMLWWAVYSRIG
jgi:chitin synthase